MFCHFRHFWYVRRSKFEKIAIDRCHRFKNRYYICSSVVINFLDENPKPNPPQPSPSLSGMSWTRLLNGVTCLAISSLNTKKLEGLASSELFSCFYKPDFRFLVLNPWNRGRNAHSNWGEPISMRSLYAETISHASSTRLAEILGIASKFFPNYSLKVTGPIFSRGCDRG